MKLSEIKQIDEMFDRSREQNKEMQWRDQQVGAHAQQAGATKGFWWLDANGKQLSGPFKDELKAKTFKENRPDRIPKDATLKEFK